MLRKLRSRMDLCVPDLRLRVSGKQSSVQPRQKTRDLCAGDPVLAKNFACMPAWMPGVIVHPTGPVSFSVELADGRVWRRHIDHLLRRLPEETGVANVPVAIPPTQSQSDAFVARHPVASESIVPPAVNDNGETDSAATNQPSTHSELSTETSGDVTRCGRRSVPPVRLSL